MIFKADFLAIIRRTSPAIDLAKAADGYDRACSAAEKLLANMPQIGFCSIAKRYAAFVMVCRHLDALVAASVLIASDAQMALCICRMSSRRFTKAVVAFDYNGPRLGIAATVELPETAQDYLAGLRTFP